MLLHDNCHSSICHDFMILTGSHLSLSTPSGLYSENGIDLEKKKETQEKTTMSNLTDMNYCFSSGIVAKLNKNIRWGDSLFNWQRHDISHVIASFDQSIFTEIDREPEGNYYAQFLYFSAMHALFFCFSIQVWAAHFPSILFHIKGCLN